MNSTQTSRSLILRWTFRVALFASAAWLALYIPFKYATQLHAVGGLYGFVFPLSSALALAGMILAWKPNSACDCSVPIRAGVGAIAALWLVTGMLCVNSLADGIAQNPLRGTFAAFQMVAQHVFLALGLLAFAFMPVRMARVLGSTSLPPQTNGDAASAKRAPV